MAAAKAFAGIACTFWVRTFLTVGAQPTPGKDAVSLRPRFKPLR